MPSGLLEPSRSKSRRPDMVFLEAKAKGFPSPPRSPQTERCAKHFRSAGHGFPGSPGQGLSIATKIAPNGEMREPSRSISGRPDMVFLEAQAKGFPSPPRSPQTERCATMECDEVGQLSSNSVHITSEELVKIEPVSFVVKEEFSNPEHVKTTVSKPARKQRKNVANKSMKLAKESEKIAKEQRKRQNKRARNPARYEENIAPLPDYSEISQSLIQELSDTNLNDNVAESSDEIHRNVTLISNAESELNSVTSSNNVSSIDIGNGQESNTADIEAQDAHNPDTSMTIDTSQAVDRLTNVDETESEIIDDVKETGSVSRFEIDSKSNTGDAKTHNLHFPDTSMASDTNQTVHSTIAESGANIGGKRHKCAHCSYACEYRCNLLRHSRIHSGEKPYKCNQCYFACAYSNNLKTHMRRHNGEKPYKCDQCSHAFAENSDLKKHIRIHTGEKPHKCSQCSFACARKCRFIIHMRTHTGEKPYKCGQCSYASAEAGNLTKHMRSHT